MSDFERDTFYDEFDLERARELIEQATNGKARCPYCGGVNWMTELRAERVSKDDFTLKTSPAFVMKDPRSHWGPSPSIPAVVMTCMGCGNLRLHNYTWVRNVLGRTEEEEPDDE